MFPRKKATARARDSEAGQPLRRHVAANRHVRAGAGAGAARAARPCRRGTVASLARVGAHDCIEPPYRISPPSRPSTGARALEGRSAPNECTKRVVVAAYMCRHGSSSSCEFCLLPLTASPLLIDFFVVVVSAAQMTT